MERGAFDFFSQSPTFHNMEKTWLVTLESYDLAWLGFILPNNPTEQKCRSVVRNILKAKKKQIQESLKKRFIYFICSKERTRFKPVNECLIHPSDICVEIPFLLGAERREYRHAVSRRSLLMDTHLEMPVAFSTDEENIVFRYPSGCSIISPVWDFLNNHKLDFSCDTEVHYVGYTKNPDSRLNRHHGGLNDIRRKTNRRQHDLFVLFNTFRVYLVTGDETKMMDFVLSNAMVGEVPTNDEGFIIEKMFIAYFDAAFQNRNKKKEYSELSNRFRTLYEKKNVTSLQIVYDHGERENCFKLKSSKVQSQWRHTCQFLPHDDGFIIKRIVNVCDWLCPDPYQTQ